MKHIGAESMKDYAWLQSWVHDMSMQHLCLSYKQHTLSILVGLYYVEEGQAYLKAMDPDFLPLHLDFCGKSHLTPCYFPIDAETGVPIYQEGCPLMNARTYQQLDLNDLGDDNGGMMSEWEVHNSGVLAMMQRGSGDRFLILVCLVNIQYSRKCSNSSREHVGNPVFRLLRMILLIRSRFKL